MMTTTPHLALPLLAAAQAQKHVTHNEALAALDGLVHLSVLERDRTAPPGSPQEGDRYLLGSGATGAFAAHDGEIALFDVGAWRFFAPRAGWILHVAAEGLVLVHDGMGWQDLSAFVGAIEQVARLGIGTAPDALNRLALKANAALFAALASAEGGTGDLRFVLNKEAAANTLSQLYQRGYSGRAETGLIGDDDFRIKVSPDGADWRDAVRIDAASAEVNLPFTPAGLRNLLLNPDFTVNQRVYAGGSLALNAYGFDRWKSGLAGTTLSRAADGTMTLSGTIAQVIENPGLAGQVITVSVENPTGTLAVDVAGAAGTIAAGPGRRSVTLAVPAAATGHVAVSLSGTGVSFARPVLNRGAQMQGHERVPHGLMLLLCQRYYEKSYDQGVAPGATGATGPRMGRSQVVNQTTIDQLSTVFAARKRAVPTVTWHSPVTGLAPRVRDTVTGIEPVVTNVLAASEAQTGAPILQNALTTGNLLQAHWVADAEL